MPYENQYSCRLRDPKGFTMLRTKKLGDGLSLIVGRPKGRDTMTGQSFRYDKKFWDKERAKNHCKNQGGSFEL